MISYSYNHFKKTMIYSHLGPFWHFSLYVLGLYLYFLHKQMYFVVSFLLFHNLLFFVTSHVQTSQKLLHDSIGMSRSNYFRHKPGLYNKNNSPQLLPASSSDSDTRESAGYHCHSTPSRKKKETILRAPINHGSHQVHLSSCEALCVQAEGFPFKLSKYQHYVHSANNLPKANECNTTKVIALTQGGQIFSCGFKKEDCQQWINGL